MGDAVWKRRVVATLVVGLLFRFVLALGVFQQMPQTEDGPSYRTQALQILDGTQGYFFFPPGTALSAVPIYAAFGASAAVDHAIAIVFWTLFSVSSAWLAWLVCADKRAAWYAAMIATFLPHGLLATCTISSQPLAASLVTSSMCLMLTAYRNRSLLPWTMGSLLLGYATITRPATIVISVVAILAVLVTWKRFRLPHGTTIAAVLALVVGQAIGIVPVVLHNHEHGQGYSISTNNEWNLLVGNNPYTPDYKTGHFGQRTFAQLPPDAREYLTNILPHEQPAFASQPQRQVMRDSAISYIIAHPLRTLYRIGNRFRGFWGMDYTASREIQNVYKLSGKVTAALLMLEGGGYLVVLLLAAIYLLRNGQSKYCIPLVFIVVTSSMLPYLLAFTVAKYHTIVLPVLFPLAAMSIVWITTKEGKTELLRQHYKALLIITVTILLIQIEHIIHIVDKY
jgi:4-amino-4-deoxy-L-arabinose transferase-like glycosyltransferase